MHSDESGAAGGKAAPPAKTTFRRKTVVVNRGFQFKYAIIMFALFGVAAFMVWWEVYTNFKSLLDQGLIHEPAAIRMVSDVSRLVLYKSILSLGIVWFLSILLSHYVAGPIYRFEACLRLLKSGDLIHRARLRPHDELKGLAAVYNEAIEALQARVGAIKVAATGGDARSAIDGIKKIADEFKV
jgi:methyl-accepting chemotaxis protein